jgi:hypothetical protein
MPLIEESVGPPHLIEGAIPVHTQGIINGVTGVFASPWLLAENFTDVPHTILADAWQLDTTGLKAGDLIFFDYAIPLL